MKNQVVKIGLLGAHRTGKTTLAKEFSKRMEIPFIPVSISSLQAEIGYNSAKQDYSFDDRIKIQDHLLTRVVEITNGTQGSSIFDRCTLDLVGYASLAITDHLSVEQGDWFKQYVTDCVAAANETLNLVTLLQPGIPLTDCATSANSCNGLIHALNLTYLGLLNHGELYIGHMKMPAEFTYLELRMQLMISTYNRLQGNNP